MGLNTLLTSTTATITTTKVVPTLTVLWATFIGQVPRGSFFCFASIRNDRAPDATSREERPDLPQLAMC